MKNFWSSRPTWQLIREVRRLSGPHGIFGRQYAIENMVNWCDVSYEEAAQILDCTEEDLIHVLRDADVAPVC